MGVACFGWPPHLHYMPPCHILKGETQHQGKETVMDEATVIAQIVANTQVVWVP